ncbi:hypothetical protein [Haladaptatus sp. YSMS36]|uniref:hypothetical protein n=1 Tax=Haladaptatus sp. YSMS36 TaxID=3033384 RepID=UPI0023E7B374|nr:hypothetical protein [Haladaptatus sp. YSMS36]
MELHDDTLSISRTLSDLDREVLAFTRLLDSCDVNYVIVSGYVAILTGRSRATEDIDVILEPLSATEVDGLVSTLKDAGYWRMAMPLDEMHSMLSDGERIRIAEQGELYPNFETWFASNDVERESLDAALTVKLDGDSLNISSIELQIAYKLRLAQHARSMDGKDFEDALHLYLTFEGQLKAEALEQYVTDLGVGDYYDELRRI